MVCKVKSEGWLNQERAFHHRGPGRMSRARDGPHAALAHGDVLPWTLLDCSLETKSAFLEFISRATDNQFSSEGTI